jgi:hypothetical protein
VDAARRAFHRHRDAIDCGRRRVLLHQFIACVIELLTRRGGDCRLSDVEVIEPGDSCGSAASAREFRMQSFGRELVAAVGRHARMTAVAKPDLLGGLGEGHPLAVSVNRDDHISAVVPASLPSARR